MRGILLTTVQKPWSHLPAPPLLKADMKAEHNCCDLGEYAENKNKFFETAYKIGSKCRYYWRAVSRAFNHMRPKKIRRLNDLQTVSLHMCNMPPDAVSIRSNVVQVTKLEKGRLTNAGLSVLIYGGTIVIA